MVIAEEDPGYRSQQMLQDAGLMPVPLQPPAYGHRPQGVSASIPQEAIDAALREGT